jgi:sialic acid synthase SpsE
MQSIWSADVTFRERFELGETGPDGTVLAIKRPCAAEKERLARLDLTFDDHLFFIEECRRHRVTPMTTIFARHRVARIAQLPWPERIVKVARYDCASWPFPRTLAQHFDTLLISTGATYDEEIRRTALLLNGLGTELQFLHCVTSYPNPPEMAHLATNELAAAVLQESRLV